jgi:cystathionine beta-lyase
VDIIMQELFQQAPDRRDSDSWKWQKYAGRDILPMWVADMDFAAPPAVQAALAERVAHGVYGYPDVLPGVAGAVSDWLAREYGWHIEADWLVWLPGLVCGLNVACRAVGEPGDAVLTATPVYPPFMSAPQLSGRELQTALLQEGADGWRWDWAAMEAALTPRTRLLMLCHPHNPVGRVWSAEELAEVADFARRHELTVCSDEIHCQLILDAERRQFMAAGKIGHFGQFLGRPHPAHRVVRMAQHQKAGARGQRGFHGRPIPAPAIGAFLQQRGLQLTAR